MKSMKTVATSMFVLALAGALIAWNFRANFAGGLIFAACEAALVGALADWFAVVALFRHPLGLKFIPHTAIIPNNRGRIIEGITAIVEKDWLSLDFIKVKLLNYPLIDGLASVLETEDGRREMERLAQSVVRSTLQELNPADVAHFAQVVLKENLDEIRISSSLIEQLESSVKNLYADDLIRLFLNWAIGAARGEEFERVIKRVLTRAVTEYSSQGNFFRRLGKGLGESLDIINYDEAAQTLSHRIKRTLTEMQDSDNQYHIKVKAELQKLKIADPDATAMMVSKLLKDIIDSETGIKAIMEFFEVFKAQFLNGNSQDMPISRYLSNMALKQINMIRQDEERKAILESQIKTELSTLLERYHGVIGSTVREKLESLDDSGLVLSLEDKVGNDLQWIRVNGTVIGALVGVLQYLILNLQGMF